jgi:CheY-like chemotaxis protein
VSKIDPCLRVLIVDDDPILLALAESQLAAAGFDVLLAANGGAALTRLEHDAVDIVTVDLGMPGMDGMTLLKRLRINPRTANLPIVVLTGKQDTQTIDEAFEAGAASFLVKPVNWALVQRHLRFTHRAAKDALRARAFRGGDSQPAEAPVQEGAAQPAIEASAEAIVAEAVGSVRPLADDRGIEIELLVDEPGLLLGVESGVLAAVLRHYLLNAVRSTPRRGRVAVAVGPAAQGGLVISVSDQGPQMKPEILKQVVTVPPEAERPAGGAMARADLVLARNLAECLGAEVNFDTEEACGNVASLILPACRVTRGRKAA